MYVVIEGIDTTGKTTQISLLRDVYKNAIFTQEPSNSYFGKEIKTLATSGNFCNKTQTMLFLADRANHTKNILIPNQSNLIISDRSLVSGIAYALDFDFDLALKINLEVSMPPDLVIILTINESVLKYRLSQKNQDNIEKNGIHYLLNVQDRILKATERLEVDCIHIDCTKDKFEVLDIIKNAINEKLK